MKILLALGANLPSKWGKPAETLSQAIGILSERISPVTAVSRFYATSAYPDPADPEFVNAVAVLHSALSSSDVMEICHNIESEAGRRRDSRWSARTLDIDLIACDDLVLPNIEMQSRWQNQPKGEQGCVAPDTLILPHPRVQDRAFVLVPMMDVAPDWLHPVLGLTTAQMHAGLPEEERRAVRLLPPT